MAYRLLAELRVDLFASSKRWRPAYLLERRSGDLVALATQDVETVEYFYAHTVAPAFVAVLIPGAVLATLTFDRMAARVGTAAIFGVCRAHAFFRPAAHRSAWVRRRGALGELGAHVTETIQGLSELIAFQATTRRRAEFMALARRYQQMRLALLDDLARQNEKLELATGLGGAGNCRAGRAACRTGSIAPTLLPLLILISIAAFLPVSEIAQVGRQLADTIASTRRLHVVHAEPVRSSTVRWRPLCPGVVLRCSSTAFASLTRGDRMPALSNVSFEVAAGSTVALVGPSGAGKTTIANLLLRFWDPDAGAVRLDGVDLRQLTLDGLRLRIALVAQDTYLFNDTLEANIRIARPDSSGPAIQRALEQAALTDFVASLPEGLQTRVGERGVQLSGGQRQRIAIARAFLKDAPILVLDEATSHLDTVSEEQVRTALDALDGRSHHDRDRAPFVHDTCSRHDPGNGCRTGD